MKFYTSLSLLIALILAASPKVFAAKKAAIVPQPVQYSVYDQWTDVPASFSVNGNFANEASDYLKLRGYTVSANNSTLLKANVNHTLQPESYILNINPDCIVIEAADKPGVMYAIESLSQIIDQAQDGKIATAEIIDSPRMQYRGMMLDLVRCYLPITEVMKIVDTASQLKLNKLHLHLTDDNGWRIEIKKYPKLTEVGAWRVDRDELFPGRSNPKPGEPTTYGGFYTQDELRLLVEYAAVRNIEVIPEIEMPAHAIGAIASYPELACPVVDEFVGVLPGIGGPAASIIMCAGNDNTLNFVTDVLDEVMQVFPSDYIHLGGDEANKSRWEKCPLCNKRVKDNHLNDFEELQAWFMDSINSYVRSKGKTAIGWDEVTYGKPKEDIIIMGWQGTGAVAENYAAETGRRFIMTPAKYTYLIRYQGPQWFEPFTYFGNITLKDVYDYDPVKPTWTPAMRDQLWGLQASMWTEFCRTPQDVQYMVFPRLLALADAAWRPKGTSNWPQFIKATGNFLTRLDDAGINYAKSMYNIQHTVTPNGDGSVTVVTECIRPDAVILFDDNPEFTNPALAHPTVLNQSTKRYYTSRLPDMTQGKPLYLDINFNKATGRKIESDNCSNNLESVMLNGIRGSDRNSDFEWAGWHNRQAQFTVDLGSVMPIRSISLGTLANANMNAGLPPVVKVYTAGDDGNFTLLKEINTDPSKRFPLTPEITDIDFGPIHTNARYIRFEAENPGPVPAGYPREGTLTWLYFDEVIVE